MGNKSEGEETWTLETAKAVLKGLEGFNIFFFEEPLPYCDPHGYAELSASTSVPVAGGEYLTTLEEFKQYADLASFDIGQPDASFIGITAFLKVASLFGETNRRVATHAWGAGGSVMENIHAAFACPNVAILEIPPLAAELHTEVYDGSFEWVDGYVLLPQKPGLGITLTEKTKAKFPFVPGSGEFNSVREKSWKCLAWYRSELPGNATPSGVRSKTGVSWRAAETEHWQCARRGCGKIKGEYVTSFNFGGTEEF